MPINNQLNNLFLNENFYAIDLFSLIHNVDTHVVSMTTLGHFYKLKLCNNNQEALTGSSFPRTSSWHHRRIYVLKHIIHARRRESS